MSSPLSAAHGEEEEEYFSRAKNDIGITKDDSPGTDLFSQIDALGTTRSWDEARPHVQKILVKLAYLATQSDGDLLDVQEDWHSRFETEMRTELQTEMKNKKQRDMRSWYGDGPRSSDRRRGDHLFGENAEKDAKTRHNDHPRDKSHDDHIFDKNTDTARFHTGKRSRRPKVRGAPPGETPSQNGLTPALAALLDPTSRRFAQDPEAPPGDDDVHMASLLSDKLRKDPLTRRTS